MASYTTNLNLVKPTINDPFNVEDANSNMQKVDDAYGKISDATIPISPDVAAALGLSGNPQVKDALGKIATFGASKRYFTSSGTFTAPYTGKYYVEVVGGGASGGDNRATWGGGYAAKTVYLTKGEQVSMTVASTANEWASGGTSSFGSYLSATGGINWSTDSGGVGSGGYGIGGDFNFTGTSIGSLGNVEIAGQSFLSKIIPTAPYTTGWGYSGNKSNFKGKGGVIIITMLDRGA